MIAGIHNLEKLRLVTESYLTMPTRDLVEARFATRSMEKSYLCLNLTRPNYWLIISFMDFEILPGEKS